MNLNTLDEFRDEVSTTENFTRGSTASFRGLRARRLCGYGSRRRGTIRLSISEELGEDETI